MSANWGVPTNILRQPGNEQWVCAVCDQPKFIVGYDRTTGQRVCRDCLPALAVADAWLTKIGPEAGICHPTPAVQS